MNTDKQTIYAPATGSAPAGVAVIRLSGPAAGEALRRLTGRNPPPPRRAARAALKEPDTGEVLDEGLVLWFPAPASFTGEDVAELHVHGGRAVVTGLLDALAQCPGLRLARPGEFTRRAFENGKLDLTAAEAIADLVGAETEAQRKQALRQLGGGLGRLYDGWRERLMAALAHLEATIDFSDQDLPADAAAAVAADIAAVEQDIRRHVADGRRGERLREGFQIAIIGPPNAGKSSLLNLLARRDAAIVSSLAGTTRDVVEVRLDLGGYPVVVADTAGLKEAEDDVEAEGVRRARVRAGEADLKLVVLDGAAWPHVDPHTADLIDGDTLVVINKADLGLGEVPAVVEGRPAQAISVHEGTGIGELVQALEENVGKRLQAGGGPPLTRARHREALIECAGSLKRCRSAREPECVAEDLRLAVRALGRITGRVGVEDMLDLIFRDFCIGK